MARRAAQKPASNRSHRPAGPAKSRPPSHGRARPKVADGDTRSHRGTKSRQDTNAPKPRRSEESDRGRSSRHGSGGGLDRRPKSRPGSESERGPKTGQGGARERGPKTSPSGESEYGVRRRRVAKSYRGPNPPGDTSPGDTKSSQGSRTRHDDAEGERLQKVLSRAGLASRREAEDWIRAGRITINGQPAVLGVRVLPSDQLRLDGRLIRQRETTGALMAFICHRSPGESLTQPHADTSPEGEDAPPLSGAALIERLPTRAGRRFITVSPMPRVDGGLELVTSDGELGVKLQRSVRHLVSQFSVRVLGELSSEQIENILGGSLDSGEQVEVTLCEASGGEAANRWYTLVARGASGKEARQLFERQGALVSRVQRTHLGSLTMERSLGRGQFRELTPEELQALLAPPPEPEEG